MRRFQLHRHADITGVSGPGLVAEGVTFSDGTTVIRWHGEHASTVIWPSIESAIHVHGHAANTEFRWLDDEEQAVAGLDPSAVWVIPKRPMEHEGWIDAYREGWLVQSYGLHSAEWDDCGTPAEAREHAARYLAAADEAQRRNSTPNPAPEES